MNTLNVERSYQITWKWTMYFYYAFYPCAVTIVIIRWLPSWMPFTCGPNEALGRNKDVWSFTCEPNEAPGKNQIGFLPVGLTKLLVETKLWGLLPMSLTKLLVKAKLCGLLPVGLTKLLVKAKLCGLLLVGLTKLLVKTLSHGRGCLWFYVFEKYWKIIWLTWCIM